MSSSQLKLWTRKEKKSLWDLLNTSDPLLVDSFPTERFKMYVVGKISWRLTLLKAPRCVPLTGHTCVLPDICSRCQSRKPAPPNPSGAFWRRSCVRGTRICEDANAAPSRSWQPQTARRLNCWAFLQTTSFQAVGISQNGCLKSASVYRTHLIPSLLICMRNGGKNNLEMIHIWSLCKAAEMRYSHLLKMEEN